MCVMNVRRFLLAGTATGTDSRVIWEMRIIPPMEKWKKIIRGRFNIGLAKGKDTQGSRNLERTIKPKIRWARKFRNLCYVKHITYVWSKRHQKVALMMKLLFDVCVFWNAWFHKKYIVFWHSVTTNSYEDKPGSLEIYII